MTRLSRREAVKAKGLCSRVGSFRKAQIKRYKVERSRNKGTWTEAQFTQRIVSHLRVLTREWLPSKQPMKDGSNSRMTATCELCLVEKNKTYEGSFRGAPKRKTNFNADHELTAVPLVETCSISLEDYLNALNSNVDPLTLFVAKVNWGIRVDRMFAETGWQLLCKDCHKRKTEIENRFRKEGKERLSSGESVIEVTVDINKKCQEELDLLVEEVRNEKDKEVVETEDGEK